jgi:gliding motility-associated lipoprotein GldH
MHRSLFRLIAVFFSAVFLLLSCGSDAVFNQSIPISGHAWKEKFHPTFKVQITDTVSTHDFVLTVRTTVDYPYSNLWLYLTINGPMGKSQRFPLEIVTADATGKWTGDKSGSLVSFSKLFMHDRFPKKGTYTLSFEQATTQKTLPEVVDVTLDVYTAENKQ